MKIVLDTDIGGDFDDANALALLAASPEVELLAVTTVGAGASARGRAAVASRLLRTAGRGDVPVHAGLDQPHLPNEVLAGLAPAHCLNAFTDDMGDEAVSEGHAVEALVDLAREHGPSLTLLSIGAQTNIAAALHRDPDAMAGVRRLVCMGGAFRSQAREANIAIDPEAADVVFRSGLPVHAVGLEQARRVQLPLTEYAGRARAASGTVRLLAEMAERYRTAYATESVTLFDVTAVVAALRPELFGFTPVTVSVELRGEVTRGMTVVETDRFFNRVPRGTVVEVATTTDDDQVRDLFVSRVLDGDLP